MVLANQGQDDLQALAATAADLAAIPEPAPEPTEDVATRLLPWGVSFLIHAGLVLLAIFVVWSTVVLTRDERIIIPTARLSATPGAPLQFKQVPRLKTDPIARRTVSPIRKQTPTQRLTQPQTDASLVGVLGSSGDANPFEATVAGGGELRANFLGSGGNARKIAFVIDASGSIVGEFPMVIHELQKSITELSGRQYFTVIFFSGNKVIEVPPFGINTKRATSSMKQQVNLWLDPDEHNVTLGHESDPVKALGRAFSYKPDLVFLLSDDITGERMYENDQQRLLREIDRVNRSDTKINTLQFLQPDPLIKAGLRGTMELIAEQSGGVYKYVSKSDLGIE